MTIEDVIKKSILPLAFMVFWFWMTKTIMKVSGQTDWFWWIFIAGLPFGIHKMRLILIPRGMDTTATLGMATLSVIIGALIGCIMIPVYVIRGNIGIEAADIIKTNSSEMIRVAGRNISKVSQRAKELFASDKWFQIKESSSNEWKDFIKGCRLVLCSAELGNETVECINRIAGELDCPIVYLGINLPKQEAEGKFIYGAGSIPGLSGIIPQYLAQDFDSVASIDFYYGAKGTFTYTAAKDYMDGVFNNSNRSMVMWKYGKLVPYVPAEVEKTNMYICNEIENMRCFPYFDDESEYLCQKYGLSEGRWHMCISGENTLKVLERARYDYQVNKDKTLRNICRASKLDCFGTTGITKFVCSIAGMVSNEVIEKSLLLTSSNPSRLTGSVAAATVLTILEMGMERGSFLLSKSKINLEVMKKLLNIGTEIRVSIRDNIGSDEIEGEI